MSKSSRELMKRKYDRANNGIAKTIEHLQEMRFIYLDAGDQYKTRAEYLEVLIAQALQVSENMDLFRSNWL